MEDRQNAEEEISVREREGGREREREGGRAYRSESDVPMISQRDVVDSGEFFLIHPIPRVHAAALSLVSVRISR